MQFNVNYKKISVKPIWIIISIFICTYISVILNISILRQVLGFVFLTLVPGALFLSILNTKIDIVERLVLSVGLSVSFIMFIGILANTVYPFFGYSRPLSQISIFITFAAVILILAFISYYMGALSSFNQIDLGLSSREKTLLIIPVFFMPMSVLGMHFMNSADNNIILMALLFLIPLYVVIISIFENHIPERAYPVIIILSSISLVILMGMRSNHIIGADSHGEYFIFLQTLSNESWQIVTKSTLDSCLSISILPVIYKNFLNIDSEYLFKILYPLLFSISPLVVYIITKNYIDNIYAFQASFFFMSQKIFLSTTANSRTTIAILFFALSAMVLLKDGLKNYEKKLFLIIFILSCTFSHYSTNYIFFAILLFSYIFIEIIKRIMNERISFCSMFRALDKRKDSHYFNLGYPSLRITETCMNHMTLIIFFLIIFIWYSQITESAFNDGVGFVMDSFKSQQSFFIAESRQSNIAAALGSGVEELELPRKISFVFNWLTIFFIAIGVLSIFWRYFPLITCSKKLTNLIGFKYYLLKFTQNSGLLNRELDTLFFSFALISSAIMAISVALPYVSNAYGLDRAYLLTSVVLSSFFVIGGMIIADLSRIRKRCLVVLIVLVPFFMCSAGTMQQIFNYPASISLNSEGYSYDLFFIYDQESVATKWMNKSINSSFRLYSDYFDDRRLRSQGLYNNSMYRGFLVGLLGENRTLREGYVFLRYRGVTKGELSGGDRNWYDISNYYKKINNKNLVYSNGGSKVFAF